MDFTVLVRGLVMRMHSSAASNPHVWAVVKSIALLISCA